MPVSAAAARTSISYAAPPWQGMLSVGSRGPAVLQLQRALLAAGFNPQGLDGSFGPKTLIALRAFQRAAGITVDGKAGPQTWSALQRLRAPSSSGSNGPAEPSLKLGATGDAVKKLQLLLESHGIRTGGVDGKFGPMTHAAVQTFQRRVGLGGSGLVGPRTWAALKRPPAQTGGTTGTGATRKGIPAMLDWAKSMIGTPYASVNPFRFGEVLWDGKPHRSVNGSNTVWNYPAGTRVFDCSGFVVAAFRKLGVDLAARGLTTSWAFDADRKFLQTVSRQQLAPGDLIVYRPKNGIGHVVIYLGNGRTIESTGGKGVVMGTVDWARVKSFRRVPLP